MTNTEMVIELAGADVSHVDAPETVLVRDVNWRIGRGEFWVVGGRQASGKSSLLLTAAGLNRPARGTLQILGQDAAKAKEKDQLEWRHRIGFVFEYGGRLFNHLTVAENIALPLQYRLDNDANQIQASVDELLAAADLETYAQHTPARLSLALQQRVGLARALASAAEILFLDNPLSTLSLREARWWLDFVRQLQETPRTKAAPTTFIASADDFHCWLDVASHFATLEDGRFNVIGGREQLTGSAEPIVREFLTSGI